MTSVFMAIPWPRQRSRDSDSQHLEREQTDLHGLNDSLRILNDVFPDIRPDVFREMLSTFSEESRVQVIAESILKARAKWAQGRYRMPQDHEEGWDAWPKAKQEKHDTRGAPLALEDTFRSETYRIAVKEAFYREFKGLSHSTIKAVLAEHNHSYTRARPTLLAIVDKSWKLSIANFFMRRKPPRADSHPLVVWSVADPRTGRPAIPFVTETRSEELNNELYDTLIVPALEKQRREQIQRDWEIAQELEDEDAQAVGELYECECCYTASILSQMAACDTECHWICFRCIRHSIKAALYGQGWGASIDTERSVLRCIAPLTSGPDGCSGRIHHHFIKRALLEEKDGGEQWRKLQQRFDSDMLQKSRLPLVHCPFCSYAEVDELHHPARPTVRFKHVSIPTFPIILSPRFLYLSLVCLIFRSLVFTLFIFLFLNRVLPHPIPLAAPLRSSLKRVARKRRGLKFTCASPACARSSCLNCHAEWHDIHICHESSKTKLRLAVERAMADAIKRTCPQCNLNFVKSEGCNKLTCVCGYKMCYVCRKEIGTESYKHFCQHFRDRPGEPCRECDKCDLYRVEDEEVLVKRAKEKTEAEWWASQKGDGTLNKGVLEIQAVEPGKWELWLDLLVDSVVA